MRNAKFESNTAFGRHKRRWENNIAKGIISCSCSKHYTGDQINETGQVCDNKSSGNKNAYRVLVRKPKEERKTSWKTYAHMGG